MKNIKIFFFLLFASLKSMGQIDTIQVNIKPRPSTPTLSATKTNINTGESVTVSASGCNGNIIWDIGTTGSSVNVSPTKTTTYSAFCNLNGCNGATALITVGVNSPIPTIKGSTNEVCSGNEVTLTAYGCGGSIEWSTGVNGNVSINVNPMVTTTYQAYCNTSAGRSAAADFTIKVNPYPTPPLVNNATIILENHTTLNATGCNGSIEWSTGEKTQSITVSPKIQTEYKVKCIQNGCPSSDAVATVTVISPKSDIYASTEKICKGKSTTLFAKNCNGTYKWNTGAIGESIAVSPTQTTQYSVVCSTSVGDGTPVYITITVNDLPNRPVLFGDTLINSGKTAKIRGICSGNAIRWGTGDTTEIINVTPKQTTWYKANCISSLGCIGASDSIRVRVATPPIEIIPKERVVKIINKRKQISICEGEKVQLDLIGCETASKVNWNSGETTRKILIQPLKNASYWASCTDNAGTKYDSLDVLVNPKPKISSEKDTIRTTLSKLTTLKVKNCIGKITWLGGGNISQIGEDTLQVIPTESIKTYRAFCTI
jgi:large repetitive protein